MNTMTNTDNEVALYNARRFGTWTELPEADKAMVDHLARFMAARDVAARGIHDACMAIDKSGKMHFWVVRRMAHFAE